MRALGRYKHLEWISSRPSGILAEIDSDLLSFDTNMLFKFNWCKYHPKLESCRRILLSPTVRHEFSALSSMPEFRKEIVADPNYFLENFLSFSDFDVSVSEKEVKSKVDELWNLIDLNEEWRKFYAERKRSFLERNDTRIVAENLVFLSKIINQGFEYDLHLITKDRNLNRIGKEVYELSDRRMKIKLSKCSSHC